MEVTQAVGIAMTLLDRVMKALRERRESIEVNDLGLRFDAVNDRIQAAREPDPGE